MRGDSAIAANEFGGVPPDMLQGMDGNDGSMEGMEGEGQAVPGDDLLIAILKQCDTNVRQHYVAHLQGRWATSYRAFANQHYDNSKYNSTEYRSRSRFFRPKTKAMVERNLTATAGAFFATADVVQTSAGNDADDRQRGGADLIGEVLNYRLQRKAVRNGIPWFQTVMGARFDCQMTGMCASWQGWKYETRQRLTMVPEQVPQLDEEGFPVIDYMTGQPVMETVQTPQVDTQILTDRSDVELIPPDQVWIDSGAHWLDPAQNAAYLNLRMPMYVNDVKRMISQEDPKCPFQWREVTDAQFSAARVTPLTDGDSARQARDGQGNPLTDRANRQGDLDIVWVDRFFVRMWGEDWFFYALNKDVVLSDPMPVAEAFPWNGGARPVVIGYDVLEPHKLFPMSQTEAVQPIQREINDIANLRLDNVKAVVSPITKVKRGKMVDLQALQRRGPNSTLQLTDLTDVEWDRPPDVTSSAFMEMEKLNIDFDEVGGVFNQGSVQSNRTMNETVGGLRLLSSAANSVSEYHLRIFVETWAEGVLSQLAKLEAYYCDDKVVLALAGKRAKLWQKYGINKIDDDLMDQEVTVRVDVGIGAADPMQKLQKLQTASQMVAPVVGPAIQAGIVQINLREYISEVFGQVGYRDGGDRFFTYADPNDPNQQQGQGKQPDPKDMAAQAKAQTDAKRAMSQGLLDMAKVDLIKAQTAKTQVDTQLAPDLVAVQFEKLRAQFGLAVQQMREDNKALIADFFAKFRSDAIKVAQHQSRQAVPQAGRRNGAGNRPRTTQ